MNAFNYRRRREGGSFSTAAVGSSIVFDERVEYALQFASEPAAATLERFRELGGEMVSADVGVLSFGNFIGEAHLSGVTIRVASTKLEEGGVSRLLEEISTLSSSLVFGVRTPVVFQAGVSAEPLAPVPYHQLQFLRQAMLSGESGSRLQDHLAVIERNHTRRFDLERPVVPLHRVRRLDQRAVRSICRRLDRLVALPEGSPLTHNPLATRLKSNEGSRAHFPLTVAAPRRRLSADTPENRFTKQLVEASLELVHRFVDASNLHSSFRADCREMLRMLEIAASAPHFVDVGRLTANVSPSQALTKGEGYRDVFAFQNEFLRHLSLPTTQAETSRLAEGRDMARLYEYWVFLKILEATCRVLGRTPSRAPEIRRDEFGENLLVGLRSNVGTAVSLRYNPTFTRHQGGAYSTPLRPDVVLEIDDVAHAFDAKYRLDRFDITESAGDLDADAFAATYKRADLYKMHTYRDAIRGLRTAFVVYPGSEFTFFERNGSRRNSVDLISYPDGVGALPLRPVSFDRSDLLERLLHRLIMQQGPGALRA